MAYLIFQILWFLLAAAAIGFAAGWLCGSLASQRRREAAAMQTHAAQGELEGQRAQLEARLAEASGANQALQEEIAQVRQAADADVKTRRKLEREHSSALIRLEAREREVARLSAELEVGRSRVSEQQPLASRVVPPLEVGVDEPDAPLVGPQGEPDDRKPASASGRRSRSR